MRSTKVHNLSLLSFDYTQEKLIPSHIENAVCSFDECSWMRINLATRICDHLHIVISFVAKYFYTSLVTCQRIIAWNIREIYSWYYVQSIYIRSPISQIIVCIMFKIVVFSNLHKLILLDQSYPYIKEEYVALSIKSCAIFVEVLSVVQLITCDGIGSNREIVDHLWILIL